MFNFNTSKRQTEPNMNSAVKGGADNSAKAEPQKPAEVNPDKEAFINARIDEIEAQRREFMKKNPDFDMKAELENPDFADYVLRMGLSVEDAYFLVHRDEIIDAAVKDALDRISARRNRISENGAGKNSPAVVKENPKDLSDKEIDSILDRVRNGEKISF